MSKGHRGNRSRYGLEKQFIRNTAFFDRIVKEKIARPRHALEMMLEQNVLRDEDPVEIKYFEPGEVLSDSYGKGSLQGLS